MSSSGKKVAVIGGGAAGFFAAINCKINYPNFQVDILEKSQKTLSKVKVSGGGRCNVTNNCMDVGKLLNFYPRGGKKLKKVFYRFNPEHTIEWFRARGVELKAETDNRMFPVTDQSHTIINCFHDEVDKLGVNIKLGFAVEELRSVEDHFMITSNDIEHHYDKVIVATGGSAKLSGFDWLKNLGHQIESPVPSLFTFNMPKENTADLMGVVAPNTIVKVQGSKIQQAGPLLLTHWGMSGPAILKTSAWGARVLADKNYEFSISVNWTGHENEEIVRRGLQQAQILNHKKKIVNANPYEQITSRLWSYLLKRSNIDETTIWAECPKKQLNKLVNTLFNDIYQVQGKTTFKEEFVTCGGVDLSQVNMNTMESRVCPGLYFAGEVIDVDGVTGGFNFQAAWSTGFVASQLKV
ncbi:MAG: putative Rossmann fold flavoprotein [Glaciecola sp.]|jgi:predicted Rossmann fold flavoprotein